MKKQKEKPAELLFATTTYISLRPRSATTAIRQNALFLFITALALLPCLCTANRITFLIPRHSKSAHQLNERNSLTNKLNSGWLLRADEKIELFMYVVVAEDIRNTSDIKAGLIFFTTDPAECKSSSFPSSNSDGDTDRDTQVLFPLTFSKGKSKMHHYNLPGNGGLNGNFSTNESLTTTPPLPTDIDSTLLVASVDVTFIYSTEKYYTCLYFAKKTSEDDVLTEPIDYGKFIHQGTTSPYTQIITTKEFLPIFLVVIFYIVLLCFSALFSGLNLGLMSLDLSELNILKKAGSVAKHERSYAAKIYPLRKKGNLLLCTILLGNVLVNSTSTLILGSYVEGLFAAIGSTMLIVIFGEIIPQAVCSRHGLAVGARTRYITYVMVGLTFVVSYPLSKVLDFFLGKEIASVYSRDKVRELMRQAMLSGMENGGTGECAGLEQKQYRLITGALDFKKKMVKDIMVPLKDVFSLDINSILDFDTFKLILYHGYSRIPVYEYTK
jgi:hypothetical protein